MSESVAPEDFRDWNEEMIRRYDPEVFHHHPQGVVRWVERRRVRAVVKNLKATPEDRILDAGCGAGNILAQLPGPHRCGIDLSAFMIKRARERLAGAAVVLHGDAEELPFPDHSFQRAVASSLLSHVLHPARIISELKRVTAPGGRIVISISHEDQIERGVRWAKALGFLPKGEAPHETRAYNVEYHLHRFSPKRLVELVGTTLRLVSMTRVPTVIFPVHWVAVYQRDD